MTPKTCCVGSCLLSTTPQSVECQQSSDVKVPHGCKITREDFGESRTPQSGAHGNFGNLPGGVEDDVGTFQALAIKGVV